MEVEMEASNDVRIQPASNEDRSQGPTVQDYFALWRFFEERGAKDKDHMITLVTWLLAFAAVIIGFIAKEHVRYQPSPCSTDSGSILLYAAVGLFMCFLAVKLVLEFAGHARINFIKADYSVARIPGLDRIFIGRDVDVREDGRWLSKATIFSWGKAWRMRRGKAEPSTREESNNTTSGCRSTMNARASEAGPTPTTSTVGLRARLMATPSR